MTVALVRNPGDGQKFQYHNSVIEQVATNAETSGAATVMRLTIGREDAPPLHFHSREDESWVVLSGRVRFWVGSKSLDECEVHDAEEGAYIFVSRLVPHTFQTITPTSEILVINNPGAIEGLFHSIGPGGGRAAAENADLAADYGVVNLQDPPLA
jgi:quercetin dioxygenase-like cupin family protein